MITEQFVSITDLQRYTKKCLQDIDKVKQKIILSNNKPKAVILSLEEYNKLLSKKSSIEEVEPYEDEIEAIKQYEEEKKKWTYLDDTVEAFSFLEKLA